MEKLVEWFIPADQISNRTDHELAWTFVFTHLFGPVLAQPMWFYLAYATESLTLPLAIMIAATWSFTALPFILRRTGRIRLVALMSFQLLAMISLYAAYHYGGFNSPFIPWLIVSLLLGLFYQSRDYTTVLVLFAVDVIVFIFVVLYVGTPQTVSLGHLEILGWLSTASATIYVTWMALYYSRVVGMKSEMEEEAEKSRMTSIELEHARATAEELGRQRSRFFSKMSHELRTPLNAIIGFSEIMLEELEEQNGPEDPRKTDVMRIKAAGKHLLSLVSRVLDISSIEAGAETLDIEHVSLQTICEDVSATAFPNVKKNGSRFIVTCPYPNLMLETDATKLRQILINLLSNAAKFTKRGIVKMDFTIVREGGEDMLRATIRDTGIGISNDGLTRIFRNYEQAEIETVSDYGGTGIGLAISKRFARMMGGEITVRSILGRGSCFTLLIPVRSRPPLVGQTSEIDESIETEFQQLPA